MQNDYRNKVKCYKAKWPNIRGPDIRSQIKFQKGSLKAKIQYARDQRSNIYIYFLNVIPMGKCNKGYNVSRSDKKFKRLTAKVLGDH